MVSAVGTVFWISVTAHAVSLHNRLYLSIVLGICIVAFLGCAFALRKSVRRRAAINQHTDRGEQRGKAHIGGDQKG
jgi:hypothetical protein